ncbi:restriction endonuclease subunit S [Geoalkalibacter halelectricus]|uniref:Restriction endonuclease subunit S n=1 Tax=Geoalkalibacter halelectricus TaxID=2847045 RepID=A0ABY5ZLV4_9BACT|nr:restriction endonuclease subunit S [Geoalkalibacter halelectricus]MDO3378544.1 restriction endonuclease subunit S [Geoalkalibacter halelectricus]UWZ80142.1 restriction endonuclease subunit S [Geoalkalibacter halelectricus]
MSEAALDSEDVKVLDGASSSEWNVYPAYKKSGVSWLGEIPEHWDLKRFKYAVGLVNEKVESAEADRPYFGLENIESWTGRRVETEGQPEGVANCFSAGDVLFGKLRPYLAKVYYAQTNGLCTGEALVLRQKDLVPRYLFYYLLSKDFINIVDSSTYGAKMPRASWDYIGNLPALLPCVEEQSTIAAFLDRETTRIDALIAKKQRLIELLQEKRTALISQAVTKGLDPGVPMKDSGVEWLGEIPAHWEVKRLGWVSESLQTGPFGTQLHASDYVDDGTPIINPANIINGKLVPDHRWTVAGEKYHELARHQLFEGDLIFGRRGEMGRCGLVGKNEEGWLCGTGCLRVRLVKRSVLPRFMHAFLGFRGVSEYLSLVSVGSTMENLNTTILGRLPVLLPPLTEQKSIVDSLTQHSEKLTALQSTIEAAITRLQEYRAALISAAVTGKIDVRSFEEGREVA